MNESPSTARHCTMSSILNGPWYCGSHACPKDDTCGAKAQNERERIWLEQHAWDNAWLTYCGFRALSITDARQATWGRR